jgi:HSP20 family protein
MHEPFSSEHIPVKLYRGSNRLVVAAPMAGMEPENITVEVTVAGELKLQATERAELKGDTEVLLDEWNPGPYYRRVDLPNAVDAELANVTYANGVLVVALPLAGQTKPAVLTLTKVGAAHGERIASHGRPVEPTTWEEHHRAGADRG